MSKLASVWMVARLNMAEPDVHFADLPNKQRCPRCNQFHLRKGYCQALNPTASAVISQNLAISAQEARRISRLGPHKVAEAIAQLIPAQATLIDCPHCHEQHVVSYTCNAMLAAGELSVSKEQERAEKRRSYMRQLMRRKRSPDGGGQD